MSNERLQKFIDDLKQAESGQASKQMKSTSNPTAAAAGENNLQKSGGNIMGRFSNRSTQYPGRIKLTKVSEDSTGVVYDSVAAEGEVYNAGTPLNAETLNALEDDLKAGMKLYRHRIRLTCGAVNGVAPIGVIEIYTQSSTAITTVEAVAPAMGITSGYVNVPVCGCNYNGDKTVIITSAEVSTYSIYLYGMYFGYVSGNGEIQRIYSSVTSVSDTVTQII